VLPDKRFMGAMGALLARVRPSVNGIDRKATRATGTNAAATTPMESGRNTARATLGAGLAVSAFPRYVPV
jgi:hypothetical protein